MKDRDRDLRDEIKTHLDMAIADRIERGATPPRRPPGGARAGQRLADPEATRDVWGRRWIEQRRRTSAALRLFRRNPGFALVAILSLTLGIGANLALFQVVNASGSSRSPWPIRPRWSRSASSTWMARAGIRDLAPGRDLPDLAGHRRPATGLRRAVRLGRRHVQPVERRRDPHREGIVGHGDLFSVLGIRPVAGRLSRRTTTARVVARRC
jgi:hypothetical protein